MIAQITTWPLSPAARTHHRSPRIGMWRPGCRYTSCPSRRSERLSGEGSGAQPAHAWHRRRRQLQRRLRLGAQSVRLERVVPHHQLRATRGLVVTGASAREDDVACHITGTVISTAKLASSASPRRVAPADLPRPRLGCRRRRANRIPGGCCLGHVGQRVRGGCCRCGGGSTTGRPNNERLPSTPPLPVAWRPPPGTRFEPERTDNDSSRKSVLGRLGALTH